MSHPPPPHRGRFAPSPTGGLHLGSALVALVAWLSVRSQGGVYIWRIEDIDGPRVVPGAAEQQMKEARWLGLNWDEGPDISGPITPYSQSERSEEYEAALATLADAGRLFPCKLSRKDLRKIASAPHGRDGQPPYPKELRPADLQEDWFEIHLAAENQDAALRFLVNDHPVAFNDVVMGAVTESVAETTGDFVLKRRDGVYAYQLAVVVDDIEMGITEVVRGADLLDSTARQIQLTEALGGRIPAYAHLPLILNENGDKLSKQNEALTLAELRGAGVSPQAISGWLAHAVGLADTFQTIHPRELVDSFVWERVRTEPIIAPNNLVELLRTLSS